MREPGKFYINGEWVEAFESRVIEVTNPATEVTFGTIWAGGANDVDRAVRAARAAFPAWSATTREERIDILERIVAEYDRRADDLAAAITEEMGAPASVARYAQVPIGRAHFATAIPILKQFAFEEDRGTTRIVKEAIGVCGFITPWNWPMNQIACKVAPALATGCTMILKPSEIAPFSGQIFAEIMHEAGVPAGVFNLVHGDGSGVGVPLSCHPDVDMISFTGSNAAGVQVAINAAPTIKRVHQELGGKSPCVVLDDADLATNVAAVVGAVMYNSGQSCNAPTRILVPSARMAEAARAANDAVSRLIVGDPSGEVNVGPVVSGAQRDRIQTFIQAGIDEGATLVSGGTGNPEGLTTGFYVRPTVFADVTQGMTIAKHEIFGPVVAIIGYRDIAHAVTIANDTDYGLAAYVRGMNLEVANSVAWQLRAGQVAINGAGGDFTAPFGGFKKSGNGREWGDYAFHEFLETKAIIGVQPKSI
jgi:aldehyde dehydrogenase (NAD+)